MRLSPYLLGEGFGHLAKVHGIVVYKLSPFEVKTFAGAIDHGVPNMVRRIQSNIFRVAPPFVLAILAYYAIEWKHNKLTRKNPADYANDE